MSDSTAKTKAHIQEVRSLMLAAIAILAVRAEEHDASKLVSPEKEFFDRATDRLQGLTYGSEQYKAGLAEMDTGLQHHYRVNRHHPECHEEGLCGMTLMDLLEMTCDWMAAAKRHADGDIWRSMEVNLERFGIDEQLLAILANTILALQTETAAHLVLDEEPMVPAMGLTKENP